MWSTNHSVLFYTVSMLIAVNVGLHSTVHVGCM